MDIDNRAFAHVAALFMQSQFKYRLAHLTGLPSCNPKPKTPSIIGVKLLEGCLLAVDQCLAAFTNPCKYFLIFVASKSLDHQKVYIDWDYEQYCNECIAGKLSDGRNSAKENKLRRRWEPEGRGFMRLSSPRTVVDLQGRIISWILPNAISPYFQVKHSYTLFRNISQRLVS